MPAPLGTGGDGASHPKTPLKQIFGKAEEANVVDEEYDFDFV